MSEKRRDSKNRILRTVESQEADGRYKYRYIDANGNVSQFTVGDRQLQILFQPELSTQLEQVTEQQSIHSI